jgi:hypothetical protein
MPAWVLQPSRWQCRLVCRGMRSCPEQTQMRACVGARALVCVWASCEDDANGGAHQAGEREQRGRGGGPCSRARGATRPEHANRSSSNCEARPCHICAGTELTAATSAPGLGSPLPHLHRDRAHPLPHLRRDWAHPLPHLRRDGAHRCHICAGTGLTPCHICAGTELTAATFAPGLVPVGRNRRACQCTHASPLHPRMPARSHVRTPPTHARRRASACRSR